LSGAADAKDVPVATRARDCISVAARDDVQILCSFDTWAMARESAEFVLPKRKSILSPPISLRAFITAVPASPLLESSTMSSTGRPRMPLFALMASIAI